MLSVNHLVGFGAVARTPSPGGDEYWDYVVSLLHFNGSDASTTFTDETGKAWTASGNAQIDTAQSKFGGASGLFDGTSDYIQTSHNTVFSVANSLDYTIEAWIYTNVNNSQRTIATKRPSSGTTTEWVFFMTSAGKLSVVAWDAAGAVVVNIAGTTTITTGAWHHAAAVRRSGTWYLYLDGAAENSGAESATPGSNTSALIVGRDPLVTTRDWNGWIDEFRMTRGVARYTAAFTPPAAAFPNYY